MSLSCVSLMMCTEDCILHTTRNRDSKEQKETSDGTLLDDVCFGCPCVMLMALMLFDFSLIVLKTLTSRPYSLPHISQTDLLYQVIAFFTYNIFAQICSKCTVYRPADFQAFLPRHLLPTASNSDAKLYSLSSLLVYGSAVLFGEYTHI